MWSWSISSNSPWWVPIIKETWEKKHRKWRQFFAKVSRKCREASAKVQPPQISPWALGITCLHLLPIHHLPHHPPQTAIRGPAKKTSLCQRRGWVSHSYAFDKKIPPKCRTLWSAKVFDWSRERLAKVTCLSAKMVICGTRNFDQPPYNIIYIYIICIYI